MPEVTVGGSISYGNIYDFVNFIDEVSDGSKTWLQWEAAIDAGSRSTGDRPAAQ